MPRSHPLYFAYGSNLSAVQMKARCSNDPARSGRPVAIAYLPAWTWIICERGYANIVAPKPPVTQLADADDASTGVYGLLYDMDPKDELLLDGYEGVDVTRLPATSTPTSWPVDMRPTEQGHGSYNKWYLDVMAADSLVADFEVDAVERVLVYVDELRVTKGQPRWEYVGRMNRGIGEATELGLPAEWVDEIVRPFIPASL